jgi:hypothetical protein
LPDYDAAMERVIADPEAALRDIIGSLALDAGAVHTTLTILKVSGSGAHIMELQKNSDILLLRYRLRECLRIVDEWA